jgi:hypothetical protein
LLGCANALRDLGALSDESPQFALRNLDDHSNIRSIAIRKTSVAPPSLLAISDSMKLPATRPSSIHLEWGAMLGQGAFS